MNRDLSPENIMIDKVNGCILIDMGQCFRVPYEILKLSDVCNNNYEGIDVTDLQSARNKGAESIDQIELDGNNKERLIRRRCLLEKGDRFVN